MHVIDWYDKTSATAAIPTFTTRRSAGSSRSAMSTTAGARRPPEALIGPAGRAAAESQRLVRPPRATHPPGTRPDPAAHAALKRILKENPDVTRKLRAMWALHVTDGLTEPELVELMGNDDEYVRSWAVYLTVALRARRRRPCSASPSSQRPTPRR